MATLQNTPVYDDDLVNKAYVDKLVSSSVEDVSSTLDYTKNWGAQPTPPYHVNDTWSLDGKLYICITERLIGEYNSADWKELIDTTTYDDFIDNIYTASQLQLPTQTQDTIIETWYTNNDPSDDWITTLLKETHNGDLWMNKTTRTQKRYSRQNTNPVTYAWNRVDYPINLYDVTEGNSGKRTIYLTKPTSYIIGDFWVIDTDIDIPMGMEIGQLARTSVTNTEYLASDWSSNYVDVVNVNALEDEYYKKVEVDVIKDNLTHYTDSEISQAVDAIELHVSDTYATKSTVSSLALYVDEIDAKVDSIEQLSNTISGQGSITLTNCSELPLYKLTIRDAQQLFPSPGLFPSTTLFPKGRYLRVVYEDSTYVRIKLPTLALRTYSEVSDDMIIENGVVTLTKRIGVNEHNVPYILSTPVVTTFDNGIIPLKKGTNTLYLESFPNAYLEALYLLDNGYTSTFANKVQVTSEIKIATDTINIEVAKKIDEDKVISKINLSPEEIKIQSSNLSLEGLTTINDGFSVDLNGNMTANNGTFTGDVYLPDGGKVIGGDGLLTNLVFTSVDKFGGYSLTGFDIDFFTTPSTPTFKKKDTSVDIVIPNNFTITSAVATISHTRMHGLNSSGSEVIGYCRNLKLYKASSNVAPLIIFGYGSEYFYNSTGFVGSEISNAFGTNGYTATNTGSDTVEITHSTDISSYLTTGFNKLYLRTDATTSSSFPNSTDDALSKTGMIVLRVDILGYSSYE